MSIYPFTKIFFKQNCPLRFDYSELGLELAQVGYVLLIAGEGDVMERLKETKITILVDSILDAKEQLAQQGAEILEPPKPVPTGYNMRVKHPDGTVVEYVEHKKME
jgi:predicted enzyme related to lactoylglutathione lyase